MLKLKSKGSKATVTDRELSKGIALGISEALGRAAIRKNLRLPSLTSSRTWEK